MTTKLAHQTQKTVGIGNGMRTATVTGVSGSAITISVAGGTFSAGVGVLTSYAPHVGDVVAVFRQDSSWLILGPASPTNGWRLMSALGYQNSWTDRGPGFPFGQYRVTASEVQIIGQLLNPGTPIAGSAICAGLPAPPGEVASIICAQGTTRPALHVDSAGVLRIYDVTVAATFLQFCGSYPLDFLV